MRAGTEEREATADALKGYYHIPATGKSKCEFKDNTEHSFSSVLQTGALENPITCHLFFKMPFTY